MSCRLLPIKIHYLLKQLTGAFAANKLYYSFTMYYLQNLVEESIWPMLAKESLKALGGLGSAFPWRKISSLRGLQIRGAQKAFVALCLLTVAGTSLLTQKLASVIRFDMSFSGWGSSSRTNFRTQIEADIRPFRGLLLGLFFVTTGTSIDMQLLIREWPNVLSLLAGLIVIKTLIITAIGPRVGLTLQESIRIGLLLSQGGEFGFVVFSWQKKIDGSVNFDASEPVVIVGFGQKAQTSRKLGFPVLYVGWLPSSSLQSAGINSPKADGHVYKTRTLEAFSEFVLPSCNSHICPCSGHDASVGSEESRQVYSLAPSLKGFGVMSDDVKVTDLVGVRTLSNNDQSQMVKQTSERSTLKSPAGTELSCDDKLHLDDEEAKGVLYCEIDTGINVQSYPDRVDVNDPVGVGNEEP
ncbi:K(+) efflux antiporter 3, chloroplastic [Sesamum angolense]|uniref:K(+) efflux antiporter 3, chloroplastic n=1 Tax=Sesamum angolense TaxID=2727404 RepID=A0AAE1T0N1_9LAMI|nr:K(+) efflux antiporter 3, chloroplastic [Sesamum angolense]